MGQDLFGKQVLNTYDSIIKVGDNDTLTGIAKQLSDGRGNDAPIWLSTARIGFGITPDVNYTLTVNGATKIGSLDVTGAITGASLQLLGGSGTQGTLSWNTDEETVDLIQNGATLQLGQEIHIHVRNNTGATINDGTPVYATGTLGASGRITVAPMIADGSIAAKYFLGVTTEDIANGQDGKVTTFGKIRGLNTSAYTEGQTLFVSTTTAGAFQTTVPVSPNLDLEVAIVISSKNNGTIFVRAQQGYYLGMLHDVYINGVSDGDLLVYDSANTRWKNESISAITNINLDTVTDNGNTTTNSINVGDINAGNVTLTGYLRGAANFVIDPAAHGDDTGTVQILGNLRVDGTTTTINSTTVTIADKNIVLAEGSATAADANGAGITIDGANATMTYNSTSDRFVFNKDIETNLIDIGSLTIGGVATIDGSRQATFTNATVGGTVSSNNFNTTGGSYNVDGTAVITSTGKFITDEIEGGTLNIDATTQINLRANGDLKAYVDATGFNFVGGLNLGGVDGISLTDQDSTIDSFFHANVNYDAGLYQITSNARYGADYIQVDGNDSRTNTAFTIAPKELSTVNPRLYLGGNNSITAPNTLIDWQQIVLNAENVIQNVTSSSINGALFVSGNISSGTLYVNGGASTWSDTTQGRTIGSIHIDPATATDFAGGAITFGASDSNDGTTAQAGIYITSDGAYGTKMYLSTTDSYAAGSKAAIEIDHLGKVNFKRQNPTVFGNGVWHSGNDGSGSGLDADLLDGIDSLSFLRSDADDVFTGNLTTGANNHITFGPNTTWGSSLRIGGNGRTATGTEMASVVTTDGNLHLDPADSANGIYLNYYAGTEGTYFGDGAENIVARLRSDGQLYKGSGTGIPYWHAGNDGSGSALDADLLDGFHLSGYSSVSDKIFNNKGLAHSTFTDFNTLMNAGANFLQGGTNGPTGGGQWYGFMLGLGSDYGTLTGNVGSYASQLYWGRQSTFSDTYLYARDLEAGTWGSWRKMSAGYADNADTLDSYHETAFLRLAANSSSPTNGAFAVGSASGRNFIQSHNGQPLDLNPIGNPVNVGTTLTVGGDVTVTGVGNFGDYAQIGTNTTAGYYQDASNGAYRANGTTGDRGYYFQNNAGASTRMYVGLTGTYAGRVGINTTGPSQALHVEGSTYVNGQLQINGYNNLRLNGVDLKGYPNNSLWFISNNSGEAQFIVGTSWDWDRQVEFRYNPSTIGTPDGTLSIGQLQKNTGTWTHGNTTFYTDGTARMRLDSAGNLGVGVGTGATNALLTNPGRGNITINGSSDSILTLGVGGISKGWFYTSPTNTFLSGSGGLILESGGVSNRLNIESDGMVYINKGAVAAKKFRVYYDMDVYNTVNLTNSSWVIQGRVTPFAGNGVRLQGASGSAFDFNCTNGYFYAPSWINISSGAGIFSSTNSAHFYPNDYSSYGTWRINGERGSYSGILLRDVANKPHVMFDSSGNGGFYTEGNGVWQIYYNISNDSVGIGGAATQAGYKAYVNGNARATGEIVANAALVTTQTSVAGYFGSVSSTWGGVTSSYPTLYSSTANRYVMHINPHISYTQNGVNGFTGSMTGATIRMASNPAAATYWDMGIGVNGVGEDIFSVGRLGLNRFKLHNNGQAELNSNQRYKLGLRNLGITESSYFPWLAHDYGSQTDYGNLSQLIIHFNGIGDRFKFNRTGAFEAEGNVATKDWFRTVGAGGLYSQTYARGVRDPQPHGNTYGNISTYNSGHGGWDGFTLGRSNMSWMGANTDSGLYNADLGDWIIYYVESTRCTGIGTSTTSGSYKAYVGGSLYATGDIVAYSDRRVKENIINIDSALDKVKALQGVYYNRINDADKVREIGFIAQDVHDAVPELASYAGDVDEWGVKYSQVTGLHNEAIKELSQKLDKKDEEIANLQAQINELKQLILNK